MVQFIEEFGHKGKIEPSFLDSKYRQVASRLIDYSSYIEFVCRDLHCLDYPEIEHSLYNARKEGAGIFIYAKTIEDYLVDRLRKFQNNYND